MLFIPVHCINEAYKISSPWSGNDDESHMTRRMILCITDDYVIGLLLASSFVFDCCFFFYPFFFWGGFKSAFNATS